MSKKPKYFEMYRYVLLFIAPVFFLTAAAATPAQTGPAYALVGIVKCKEFTGAVLDDGRSGQALYRLREQLPDGSHISRIRSDSVTIRENDGGSYDLFVIQGAKPSSGQGGPAAARAPVPPPDAVLNRQEPRRAVQVQEPGAGDQAERRAKRRILRRR